MKRIWMPGDESMNIPGICSADRMRILELAGPAYSAGFNPSALSPYIWFDADVGVTGIGEVTVWADQSGNGHDATKGTTGPALIAIDPNANNHATIDFPAAGTWMATASFGDPATSMIFFVGYASDAFGVVGIDGATAFNSYQFYNPGGSRVRFLRSAAACDMASNIGDNTLHVWCVDDNGAASKIYEDSLTAGVTGDPGGPSAPGGLSIGAFKDGSGSWRGRIAYIFVCPRLGTTDRTNMMNFLGTRYGRIIAP